MKKAILFVLLGTMITTMTFAFGTTETTSAPTDDKTLTVYLNDFDAVIGEMFEAETGYKLNIVVGNGAETMSRIAAERGNPQWDVVWADMMPSIHGMMENDELLTNWTPENAKNLTDFAKEIVPADKGYYPTGAHSAGVLIYRTDIYTDATAPSNIFDLATGDYKVGMADPGVAAPAYPLAAYFMYELGLENGKKYFTELFEDGLKVYPKNPQVVQALASGEIDVALLQETNSYDMVKNGEPVAIIWPSKGAPASVRVAAISSSTKKEEIAKEFVNFLLSTKTQQGLVDLGDEGLFEPSVKGVEMNQMRKDDGATLDYAEAKWASDNEAEIKAWFADMSAQ